MRNWPSEKRADFERTKPLKQRCITNLAAYPSQTPPTDSVEEALTELGEDDYSEDDIRLMRIKFMSELGN